MLKIYENEKLMIYHYDEDSYYVCYKNEQSKNYFTDEAHVRNIVNAETKYMQIKERENDI